MVFKPYLQGAYRAPTRVFYGLLPSEFQTPKPLVNMVATRTTTRARARIITSSRTTRSSMSSQSQPSKKTMKNIDYKHGPYTELIIKWLEQNPLDRQLLFSDNIQNATAEGRRLKTSKHPKSHYYRKIADSIFPKDETHQDEYKTNPDRFSKSVENHVQL